MKNYFLLLLLLPFFAQAQDDLLGELDSESLDTEYAFATFKGTRLGNGHTVETKNAHTLEFIFQHRFGDISSGAYDLFGLDQAYVRLALDYGITDNLSVSIGRNSYNKTVDGYIKYKLIRQSKGKRNFPVTITAFSNMAYQFSPQYNSDVSPDYRNVDRISYTEQLLIARKFSSKFSFQIMPTFVHKNSINYADEVAQHNQVAIGFGSRFKVARSVAITGEYYANLNLGEYYNAGVLEPYHNSFCLGVDLETGGHVFQLVLTNAIGLTERAFITETEDDFFGGQIHLGFNITRTFQLKKNK